MANRGLLHVDRLDDFKEWLIRHGYVFVPTKSIYEVIRAVKGYETVIIYRRSTTNQHFTVPSAYVRLVRQFTKETKGGINHGRKESYGSGDR